MNKEQYEIKLVTNWSEHDIVKLYKAGGWWKNSYNPSGIKNLIKGSSAFAVAIDKKSNEAIGMGRLISDKVSDAYIQDLVILPEYRKKGIGKLIVKTLINFCESKNINWIGLIAEPNQDGFYENLGFKIMKDYVPMKYHGDD